MCRCRACHVPWLFSARVLIQQRGPRRWSAQEKSAVGGRGNSRGGLVASGAAAEAEDKGEQAGLARRTVHLLLTPVQVWG
jgi:hypothetical protein